MAALVKETDAIVNFAAETHVDRSISNPYAFIESNVIGTYTILEAMRKANPDAKLVHVSEISIIETKAKSLKIGGNQTAINEKFNEGLSVLSADEKG